MTKPPIEEVIEDINAILADQKPGGTRFEVLDNRSHDCLEVFWFDRKLNHRERERIKTYLMEKYGTASKLIKEK